MKKNLTIQNLNALSLGVDDGKEKAGRENS